MICVEGEWTEHVCKCGNKIFKVNTRVNQVVNIFQVHLKCVNCGHMIRYDVTGECIS